MKKLINDDDDADEEVSPALKKAFENEGATVHTGKTGHIIVTCSHSRFVFADALGVKKFAREIGLLDSGKKSNKIDE